MRVKDHELRDQLAKDHPYAFKFNMGLGKVLESYKEAVNALMERNMPDVLHDKQTKVIFLPETHLPKKPRVVDPKRFVERRKKLQDIPSPKPEALAKLLKRPGDSQAKDQDIIKGDLTEKELMEELKKFFVAADDQEV